MTKLCDFRTDRSWLSEYVHPIQLTVNAFTLASESLRNVGASIARTTLTLAALVGGLTATVVGTYLGAHSARQAQAALELNGYGVVVLSGSITGTACDGLSRLSDVVVAGAASADGNVVVRPGDLATYSAYFVSPGFISMVSSSGAPSSTTAVVGQEAASELGLFGEQSRSLTPISASGSPSGVATTYSVSAGHFDAIGTSYERSILLVANGRTTFTQCLASLRLPAPSLAPQILAAEISPSGSVTGQWLVSRSVGSLSPADIYLSNPVRWIWLIMAVLTSLAAAGLSRARGVEFAVYRSYGASMGELSTIVLLEFLVLSAVALITWPVGLVFLHPSAHAIDLGATYVALRSAIAYTAASALGMTFASLLTMLGSPWELLRRQ